MNEKYVTELYKVADAYRGTHSIREFRMILTGALVARWYMDYDSAKEMLSGNDFLTGLKKAIDEIERNNDDLNGALTSLLLEKAKKNAKLNEALKRIFEEIENVPDLSKGIIKDMVNHLLFDIDQNGDFFITPESIKKIMVGLVEPFDGSRVADYFAGIGSIIVEMDEAYGDRNIEYYGEELNGETYLLSLLLTKINGVENCRLENKDVYMLENSREKQFDYVVMDAPFSMKNNLEKNRIFSYGLPSKMSADWANFQIALYSLKDGGKALATATLGSLFRSSDRKIRKAMVDADKIEAVIQLPGSLYVETAIPTVLIVFNSAKNLAKRNRIVFVDASKNFVRKNRSQNELREETIAKVIKCVNEGIEMEGFSTIVESDAVRENSYNLNSNVYINSKVIESRLGDTKQLEEIAEVLPGVQIGSKDMEVLKRNPTHYYLNIKNIQEEGIAYDEEEKIRDKKIDWYGKYDINAGDIIITTKGTTTRMVIVPDEFKPSFISNNLTIIRVDKLKFDPYVLKKYLESDTGKLVLENITTGTTISLINARRLEGIRVPDYGEETVREMGLRIKTNEDIFRKTISDAKEKYEKENKKIIEELKLRC